MKTIYVLNDRCLIIFYITIITYIPKLLYVIINSCYIQFFYDTLFDGISVAFFSDPGVTRLRCVLALPEK